MRKIRLAPKRFILGKYLRKLFNREEWEPIEKGLRNIQKESYDFFTFHVKQCFLNIDKTDPEIVDKAFKKFVQTARSHIKSEKLSEDASGNKKSNSKNIQPLVELEHTNTRIIITVTSLEGKTYVFKIE
jgi:hypothetical protein